MNLSLIDPTTGRVVAESSTMENPIQFELRLDADQRAGTASITFGTDCIGSAVREDPLRDCAAYARSFDAYRVLRELRKILEYCGMVKPNRLAISSWALPTSSERRCPLFDSESDECSGADLLAEGVNGFAGDVFGDLSLATTAGLFRETGCRSDCDPSSVFGFRARFDVSGFGKRVVVQPSSDQIENSIFMLLPQIAVDLHEKCELDSYDLASAYNIKLDGGGFTNRKVFKCRGGAIDIPELGLSMALGTAS